MRRSLSVFILTLSLVWALAAGCVVHLFTFNTGGGGKTSTTSKPSTDTLTAGDLDAILEDLQ